MEVLARNFPQLAVIALALLLVARLTLGVFGLPRRPGRRESRSIRVIGVGGGGSNAVGRMIAAGTSGTRFIACNTDAQALRRSAARRRIRIGQPITKGLGAGGDPAIGQRAAEEDADRIARELRGSELVFVTAGLGGGTGSGAAPVIAGIARDEGALTIGVVTKPFAFEGQQRQRIAEASLEAIRSKVDALIVVPNDRVQAVVGESATVLEAFRAVDDVLRQAIEAVVDIITVPGLVNLDFADVRAVMKDGGLALVGVGRASGDDRAVEAARRAVSGPLLDAGFAGARAILFLVTGPPGLTLSEVRRAADVIRSGADPEANVLFGATFDQDLGDELVITVLATGLAPAAAREPISGPETAPLDQGLSATVGHETEGAIEPRRPTLRRAPVAGPPAEPPEPGRPVARTDGEPPRQDRPPADAADSLDVPTFLRQDRTRHRAQASRRPVRGQVDAVPGPVPPGALREREGGRPK